MIVVLQRFNIFIDLFMFFLNRHSPLPPLQTRHSILDCQELLGHRLGWTGLLQSLQGWWHLWGQWDDFICSFGLKILWHLLTLSWSLGFQAVLSIHLCQSTVAIQEFNYFSYNVSFECFRYFQFISGKLVLFYWTFMPTPKFSINWLGLCQRY